MTKVVAECFTATCDNREIAVLLAESFLKGRCFFPCASIVWSDGAARVVNSEGDPTGDTVFIREEPE